MVFTDIAYSFLTNSSTFSFGVIVFSTSFFSESIPSFSQTIPLSFLDISTFFLIKSFPLIIIQSIFCSLVLMTLFFIWTYLAFVKSHSFFSE